MGRSPLNVDFRVVMLDETDEAPGVQGIGIPRLVFWVWQDGDGHSPNGMTRDPWFGTYWKVQSSSEFTHPFFFSSSRSGTCPRSKSPRSTPTTNTSIKHLFNSYFPKNKLSTRESPPCSTPSSNSLFECSPIPWRVEKISIYWRNLFVALLIRKQNTLRMESTKLQ